MTNTFITHQPVGKLSVVEHEPVLGLCGFSLQITDEDPDSTLFRFELLSLQQLDSLIHGLESVRQDRVERERAAERAARRRNAAALEPLGVGGADSTPAALREAS